MEEKELLEEIIALASSKEEQRKADETLARLRSGVIGTDRQILDLKEHEIMNVLKVSYIARRFFGRSRSWLCHKLNHDVVNGRQEGFTEDERIMLKNALDTIASELQILSDQL